MSNQTDDKKVLRIIYALSVFVPVAVAFLMVLPAEWKQGLGISENSAVSSFPFLHAVLNGMKLSEARGTYQRFSTSLTWPPLQKWG